jgi:hypothetical protein
MALDYCYLSSILNDDSSFSTIQQIIYLYNACLFIIYVHTLIFSASANDGIMMSNIIAIIIINENNLKYFIFFSYFLLEI